MKQRLGINCHLLNNPSQWEAVASLGIAYARLDLNWDLAAPSRAKRTWDILDRAVDGALAHGLTVYGSIGYTPHWANYGAGRGRPPMTIREWELFVQEIGARYREKVSCWGIWNEFQGPPQEYVEYLFRPAYDILKALNPRNLIGGPECATEGDWPAWLTTFLQLVGTQLDILTIHAYAKTGRETWAKIATPRPWWGFWRTHSILHVAAAAGYTGPIWLTECGAESRTLGLAGQANYWDELLERLEPSVRPEVLFVYQALDEPDVTFGVLDQNAALKPAASVIQRFARRSMV